MQPSAVLADVQAGADVGRQRQAWREINAGAEPWISPFNGLNGESLTRAELDSAVIHEARFD